MKPTPAWNMYPHLFGTACNLLVGSHEVIIIAVYSIKPGAETEEPVCSCQVSIRMNTNISHRLSTRAKQVMYCVELQGSYRIAPLNVSTLLHRCRSLRVIVAVALIIGESAIARMRDLFNKHAGIVYASGLTY